MSSQTSIRGDRLVHQHQLARYNMLLCLDTSRTRLDCLFCITISSGGYHTNACQTRLSAPHRSSVTPCRIRLRKTIITTMSQECSQISLKGQSFFFCKSGFPPPPSFRSFCDYFACCLAPKLTFSTNYHHRGRSQTWLPAWFVAWQNVVNFPLTTQIPRIYGSNQRFLGAPLLQYLTDDLTWSWAAPHASF